MPFCSTHIYMVFFCFSCHCMHCCFSVKIKYLKKVKKNNNEKKNRQLYNMSIYNMRKIENNTKTQNIEHLLYRKKYIFVFQLSYNKLNCSN